MHKVNMLLVVTFVVIQWEIVMAAFFAYCFKLVRTFSCSNFVENCVILNFVLSLCGLDCMHGMGSIG